jgi:hypothetical protein
MKLGQKWVKIAQKVIITPTPVEIVFFLYLRKSHNLKMDAQNFV